MTEPGGTTLTLAVAAKIEGFGTVTGIQEVDL